MKKFNFKISGNKYEVHIQNINDNIVEMEVNGTKFNVEVEQAVKAQKTPKLVRKRVPAPTDTEKTIQKSASGGSGYLVKSPLPGNIFKMLVSEGDSVAIGDNLLILEAMKMENNILAEKAGTIKSIKVKEGDSVLQNDVLVEIV